MVDIIIPAYNCADTLPRALASVMTQTMAKKCIVTVVDDCSTQDLKPIIEQFKPYLHLKYLRMDKNSGTPGLPRQMGIDNTNAPFIMFMDADDMLAPQAVEILNKSMLQSTVGVTISEFFQQDKNYQMNIFDTNQSTWIHGNIYRRSFLEKYNIRFSQGVNEDGAFNTQCYLLSGEIGKVQYQTYYWLHNQDSITRSTNGNFRVAYGDHIINTLTDAYKNIFAHSEKTKLIMKNLGSHLGFFYLFLNEAYEESRLKKYENSEENYEKILNALINFSAELHLNQLTKKEIKILKVGFVEKIIGETPLFTNEDSCNLLFKDYFSKILQIPMEMYPEDFIGGAEQ